MVKLRAKQSEKLNVQKNRLKKPVIARLDEVTITRDGDTANIEYVDPTIGGVNLRIGPQLQHMADQDVLNCHNDVLRAQQLSVANYKHVAVEIPEGLPQVRYFDAGDQWVPRGDVLRCLIHDDEDRQPVIEIDGREFSLEEFGSMLTAYAGWGMRVTFVPDNALGKNPEIEVKDADTE
jgi:hypothetical protein